MATYKIHLPISKETYNKVIGIDFGSIFLMIALSGITLITFSLVGASIGAGIMSLFNMSPITDMSTYGAYAIFSQPIVLVSVIITDIIALISVLLMFGFIEFTYKEEFVGKRVD